jgi:hypothetical protein
MQVDWFRAYVDSLLREVWDGQADTDDDGDWPFRHGSAAGWVSVRPWPYLRVEVFAHAARDVKQSARLLRELNEANWFLVDGRVYWRDGFVVAETSIEAERVDRDSLIRACLAVGGAADELGTLLAAMFDGQTPFPAVLEA